MAPRIYGAIPSTLDSRDQVFHADLVPSTSRWKFSLKWPFVSKKAPDLSHVIKSAPGSELVTLAAHCGPIRDQGSLGSCSGQTGAGLRDYIYRKFYDLEVYKPCRPDDFVASAMFIYWWNRRNDGKLEVQGGTRRPENLLGYTQLDRGATLRALMRTLRWQGACQERTFPYRPEQFRIKPTLPALSEGVELRAGRYMKLNSIDQWKSCLSKGYPIAIGMFVYQSLESTKCGLTGILEMPSPSESYIGGHAVLVIGFDEKAKTFLVRNSWGSMWGDVGHFHMPYEYAEKYVFDAWMMSPFTAV